MDAVLICVPTPLDERREPDLSYVENTAKAIAPNLQRNQLIVLESTTYPGTTEELVLPILEKGGLRCPLAKGPAAENTTTDFYLAFSPEREDPGNKQYGLAQIPKVVGGINPPSGRAAAALYAQIVSKVVPVSSTRAAEMVKLLENIFRCVNIALVNELKQLSLRMDLDIWEVIDSAATKPFGFMPFYPGPGLGGHCIPVDPYYLSWKAREYDFATRFIELAGEINTAMPYNVVEAVVTALNDHQKSVKGSKILLLGVAYKKDVDDLRESPSLKLLELLTARGATLDYNDPYFPRLHKMRHYDFSNMQSVELTPERLQSYDCVLIATDHTSYDYAAIVRHVKTRRGYPQRDAPRPATPGKSRPLLTSLCDNRRIFVGRSFSYGNKRSKIDAALQLAEMLGVLGGRSFSSDIGRAGLQPRRKSCLLSWGFSP